MQSKLQKAKYQLGKLSNRRTGWPVASLAFYGPDATRASKVVLSLIPTEDADAHVLRKWFVDGDARADEAIFTEVFELVRQHGAARVVTVDRVIGCPHESGVDYECDYCPRPECAYWVGRNRWTGEVEQ